VTALASGHVASLTAGQTAVVNPNGVLALGGAMPRPTVFQGTRRGPFVGLSWASLLVGTAADHAGLLGLTSTVSTIPAQVRDARGVELDVGGGAITVAAGAGGAQAEAGPASITAEPGGVQIDLGLGK
jgi:hypothetical protein